MKVLVTGAAGFIGSHLVEALRGREVKPTVIALDRKARPSWLDVDEYVEADLTHRAEYRLRGIDTVFHLAARPGTPQSWDRFDLYLHDNVYATEQLIAAMIQDGCRRLIYVSSSSVYGKMATRAEDSILMPCSPYGVTKMAAEHFCRALCDVAGIDLTIIRPFSVYGPRQRSDMFFHIAIEAMLAGKPVYVTGSGTQSRSFTYVSDVVDALVTILEKPHQSHGQTFNVGRETTVPLMWSIDMLGKLVGVKPDVRFLPARRGDQDITWADTGHIEGALGWSAKIMLEDGLARQVAWHREEHSAPDEVMSYDGIGMAGYRRREGETWPITAQPLN